MRFVLWALLPIFLAACQQTNSSYQRGYVISKVGNDTTQQEESIAEE